MRLIECYMKNSTWYKSARPNGKPIGVLWHDTGAGNPYLKRYVQPYETDANYDTMISLLGKNKYNNDWNHIEHEAGLNAWIGKLADETIATVQVGELTKHPWGCGGGSNGSCNGYITTSSGSRWVDDFWVQFEICDDRYQDQDYFEKVYKEACEFTAYVCKKYNIDPAGTVQFNGVSVPTILCHADSHELGLGNNHADVYLWFNKFGKSMNDVRKDVAKIMGNAQPVVSEPSTSANDIKAGDLVSIKPGATYYNGASIPQWVIDQRWYVESVNASSDRVIINKSENGNYSIMSAIKKDLLIPVNSITENTTIADPEEAEKTIWDFLTDKLGNEFAAAGVMGNLYAESGLCSYNLQNVYEKTLGMSDMEYTLAVDNDTYSKDSFVYDKAGYGIAQWTFYARKGSLYDFSKEQHKSIGDLQMQLDFLWKELLTARFLEDLTQSKTVLEASNIILTQYERPSDQSEAVQAKRAEYGQKYYDKYHTATDPVSATPVVNVISPDTMSDGTYLHSHEEAQNFLLNLLNHVIDFIMKSFKGKE